MPEPVRLWFRPPTPKAKWRLVGVFRTRLDAVERMSGSGDYLIREADGPDPNHERAGFLAGHLPDRAAV